MASPPKRRGQRRRLGTPNREAARDRSADRGGTRTARRGPQLRAPRLPQSLTLAAKRPAPGAEASVGGASPTSLRSCARKTPFLIEDVLGRIPALFLFPEKHMMRMHCIFKEVEKLLESQDQTKSGRTDYDAICVKGGSAENGAFLHTGVPHVVYTF